MARVCLVCDKKPSVVNNVSHANNKTKRWVFPNVHRMRFKVQGDISGKVKCGMVCTKCMKAGKVQKVL